MEILGTEQCYLLYLGKLRFRYASHRHSSHHEGTRRIGDPDEELQETRVLFRNLEGQASGSLARTEAVYIRIVHSLGKAGLLLRNFN